MSERKWNSAENNEQDDNKRDELEELRATEEEAEEIGEYDAETEFILKMAAHSAAQKEADFFLSLAGEPETEEEKAETKERMDRMWAAIREREAAQAAGDAPDTGREERAEPAGKPIAVTPVAKLPRRKKRRAKLIAILAAALVVLGGTGLLFSVDAVRYQLLGMIYQENPKYSSIYFKNDKPVFTEEWIGSYVPMYITEGYYLEAINFNKQYSTIFYQNSNKQKITFFQYRQGTAGYLDNEFSESQDVDISGNVEKGKLITVNGEKSLIWTNGEFTFELVGDLETSEFVKIAESLEKVTE